MAGGARLRTTARVVLAAWLLAATGETVAAAACCEPADWPADPPPAHVHAGHAGEPHHVAPQGPEHRHCPLPELRPLAVLPAKAAALPLPRPLQAPPPRGVERRRAVRAHTRRVQPRAPPPAELLRLIPRLRI